MNTLFSKEVRIGLLALVSGVVLFYGVRFLLGSDIFSPQLEYYTEFDRVDGLTVSNTIQVQGFAVGRVKEIHIVGEGNKPRLRVTLLLDYPVSLTDSSMAVITADGLLGGKMIELRVGNGTKLLEPGSNIRGSIAKGLTDALADKAGPLISNLDSTTLYLNRILRDFGTTQRKLEQALTALEQGTNSMNAILVDNRENLSAITGNIKKITADFVETEKGLKTTVAKLNQFGDTLNQAPLKKAITNTSASLENLNKLLADINSGKGSMGKLAKNDSLYHNLNQSTANLAALLADMKANPKRYVHFSVFGRKN